MTREEAAAKLRDKAADPYYVPRLRELYQLAAEALSEPEIIRCKDCEHWLPYEKPRCGRCSVLIKKYEGSHKFLTSPSHFCGYAIRREDHGR